METNSYCLENKHNSYLVDFLRTEAFENESFDVTILCGTQQLKAHRVVLAAISPYFFFMLKDHSSEDVSITLDGYR